MAGSAGIWGWDIALEKTRGAIDYGEFDLRLTKALGGGSRVTGTHGPGGDRKGSARGRAGELGDGLAEHFGCVLRWVRLGRKRGE